METIEELQDRLQQSLEKLRTSLKYWRTWEADYVGLKDDLEAVDHEPTSDEMVQAALDIDSDTIDEKEIKSIIQYDQKYPRTRSLVIQTINGRIETGRRNTESIQKQIDKLESQLDETSLSSDKVLTNEDGDDLMEIIEELDENGNIVTSEVANFNETADKMKEILASRIREKNVASKASENPPKPTPTSTFTANREIKQPTGNKSSSSPPSRNAVLKQKQEPNPEEPDLESNSGSDSDPDDLQIQKEMLQNMQNIRPVVATMDLEEAPSDENDDAYYYDDSEEEDEDEDDDIPENDFGMTNIGNELSPEYIQRMQALMNKQLAISKPNSTEPKSSKAMKGVRFADALDISESPRAVATAPVTSQPSTIPALNPIVNTMASTIVERPRSSAPRPPSAPTPPSLPTGKLSKFKASREYSHALPPPQQQQQENQQHQHQRQQKQENPVKKSSPPQSAQIIPERAPSPAAAHTMKQEFALYRDRLDAGNGIERSLFTDRPVKEPEVVVDDESHGSRKMSRFKMERLGFDGEESL